MQELCLALFLLMLHLRWDAWPCQREEGPAAIAIRADGISGGLQPAHTAVQFLPEDSLNDVRVRCSCLSASFSLPVHPTLQPMQSHNDTGFSYVAVLHS